MIRKFAVAEVLDAHMGDDLAFAKSAHRVSFKYAAKPGYLYVRSRAISSRCNDNFDMFPAEEIEKSYRTFIGKPVFVNHHNEDHRRARGVIIDAALHKDVNPDGSPDTWVELLHEIDALTYPKFAKAILAKEIDRTSMGCDVQISKCSACGNEATSPLEYCSHIPGKKGKRLVTGVRSDGRKETQLIFEICSGLSFFENSFLVEPPADPTAWTLGNIEFGPGLEHLTSGLVRSAAFHPASPTALNEAYYIHENNETDGYDSGFTPSAKGIEVHDYPRALNELRSNWQIHDDNLTDEWNPDKRRDAMRRREVGKLINSLEDHHRKNSSLEPITASNKEIEHNKARFGCWHIACGRHLEHRTAAAPWLETKMRGVAEPIEPVRHIVEGARAYNSLVGLPDPHQGIDYHAIRQTADRVHHLSRTYAALPHYDPQAVPNYAAMRDEVNHQFDHLTNRMGIRAEFVNHDPYRNAAEMVSDLRNNKRIQVLRTAMTGHHPFFSDEENDRFRAVHDAFGHAATGRDFDGHGEEAAFHSHARMFSPMARGAMATETRGQNGYVIHHDQFGPQKIAVMHHSLWTPAGMERTSSAEISDVWNLIKQATESDLVNAAEEGVANDHVRSFEGRSVPDHGDRVAVYRDLSGAPKSGYPARGSWSVKRLSERGGKSALVYAHTVGLHVTDARPTFDEAARKKFKDEEKRGVHAYIGGTVHHYAEPIDQPEGEGWRQVSYYPDISHFFMKDNRNKYHGSDEAAFLGGRMWARGNIKEGDDGPVPLSRFEQPKTGSIWSLIYEADLSGDDLYPWDDLSRVAKGTAVQDRAEAYLKEHPIGIHHILSRVEEASADPATLHSGMKWYDDAHGMAKTMASHHQVPLQHVAGTLGVYSSSSAPAPNFHYASEALHSKRGIYSKPIKDETGKTIGNEGYKGESPDYRGLPMASEADAHKVNRILSGEHYDDVIKSNKTRLYARLIHHPENNHDVVIDRHAVAAAVGHSGKSGEPYNAVAAAIDNKNNGDSIYDRFAQAYRDTAHVLNTAPSYKGLRTHLRKSGLLADGEKIKPHQVQALAWVVQKGISDSHGHDMTDSNQRQIDLWQKHYTDRYGPTAHQPVSGEGFYGQEPTQNRAASLRRSAYGETKAPRDVDTLRAENCVVCGNSTAFDGVQCQICGYVAPPRPFGDPDTDAAKDQDMRKEVLDSADNTADPNDPDQQLGNQVGNPEELDDQAADAEAEGTVPALTCTNCGVGIQPAPATTDNGEPPYPSEGDACPVCNKGELTAAEGDEGTGEEGDDTGEGVPDNEEEEGDSNGDSNPFAQQDNAGQSDSESDDDEDEDDDDEGKKKK